ncbi:MAG: hypothetical protein M3X11_10915 [Acidobacteriota bacterium]|nr:hypothetical protein [Acidobacteriota bacterium]
MGSRFEKTVLPAGLSALLLIAQSACSSNESSNNLATTSPTPLAASSTGSPEASSASGLPANPNTAGGGAASSASGSAGAPPSGTRANPGLAGSGSGAASTKPPAPVAYNPPPPPPAPPRVYTINSGTPLSVWTTSSISTKTAKAGDRFTATLANSIVDGNWVIAKKGATVEGTVTDADPGGKVKGLASLSLRLDRLTLADGRSVSLATSRLTREAKSTKKKDAVKVGIGAGIGAAIGAIAGGGKGAAIGAGAGGAAGGGYVLGTRGDPAVIPGESQLSFRLTSPVKVTKR